MTHREMVLSALNKKVGTRMSLTDLTTAVAKKKKISMEDAKYLSGSLSTLLLNMIDKGEVYVDKRTTGPLGGKMYYTKK